MNIKKNLFKQQRKLQTIFQNLKKRLSTHFNPYGFRMQKTYRTHIGHTGHHQREPQKIMQEQSAILPTVLSHQVDQQTMCYLLPWMHGKHRYNMQETTPRSSHDSTQISQGPLKTQQKIACEIFQIEKYNHTHKHDSKFLRQIKRSIIFVLHFFILQFERINKLDSIEISFIPYYELQPQMPK